MLYNKILSNNQRSKAKALVAGLLLLLYVAGNNQFETFHQILHSHSIVEHSEDEENNPCHRSIFHQAKEDGCEHKVHLTDNRKCPLCHVATGSDQLTSIQNIIVNPKLSSTSEPIVKISFSNKADLMLPARAPPVA